MNSKELKKVLADSLALEKELYEFCVECLTRIYGENASFAINMFNESIDFHEYNCCISSLRYIDDKVKELEISIKKRLDNEIQK
jgi:hypothetical protein